MGRLHEIKKRNEERKECREKEKECREEGENERQNGWKELARGDERRGAGLEHFCKGCFWFPSPALCNLHYPTLSSSFPYPLFSLPLSSLFFSIHCVYYFSHTYVSPSILFSYFHLSPYHTRFSVSKVFHFDLSPSLLFPFAPQLFLNSISVSQPSPPITHSCFLLLLPVPS